MHLLQSIHMRRIYPPARPKPYDVEANISKTTGYLPIPTAKSTNIDRRTCTRIVPMRLLVLGLSRTGTESLRKALVELGYDDTYHGYAAAVENPRDCEMWLQAFRAKFDGVGKPFGREEWDMLLGHCQAVCDVPAACFATELMEAYPDAKVILTNRDIDAWYLSVRDTLVKGAFTPWAFAIGQLAWVTRSPNRWTRPAMTYPLREYFDGDFAAHGKEVYTRHYASVRSVAAESKMELLEYKIQDGWGPLCEFLGCEVPDMPFPCGNSKKEVNRRIQVMIGDEVTRLMWVLLGLASGMIGVCLLAAGIWWGIHKG